MQLFTKNKKNILIIGIVLIFFLICFISYSKAQNNRKSLIITVPYKEYKEDLEFYVIEDFKKNNKDIDIQINYLYDDFKDDFELDYNESILENLPNSDVYLGITFSQYFSLYDSNKLFPLDKLFSTTDFDPSLIFEPIYNSLQKNNHIYAIPMGFYSYGLAYNTDIFNELNIQYPHEGITWDEVMILSKQIKEKSQYFGIALSNQEVNNLAKTLNILTYPLQDSFYIIKDNSFVINENRAIPFIYYLKDGIRGKYIAPSVVDFFKGNTAMAFVGLYDFDLYNNSWDKKSFAEIDYNIIQAPFFDEAKTNTYILPGDMLCISHYSNEKEAAWRFIDYVVRNYYKRYDSGTYGWFPVYKDGSKSIMNKHYEFDFSVFYGKGNVIEQTLPIVNAEKLYEFNEIVSKYTYDYIFNDLSIDNYFEFVKNELTKTIN
ncbi:ABC transporter substrate-binding protein [Alkaliphilus crotonatoxidans]